MSQEKAFDEFSFKFLGYFHNIAGMITQDAAQ